MNEIIGTADCLNPECKKPVPVKQQRNALAVMSCAWCGCLVQAHGAKADKFLRSRMTAEKDTAEAAGEVAPVSATKPAPTGRSLVEAADDAEPTIFDVFKRNKKAVKHAE